MCEQAGDRGSRSSRGLAKSQSTGRWSTRDPSRFDLSDGVVVWICESDPVCSVGGLSRRVLPRVDYLKGTVTGPGLLEKTAMKSRSSGMR
jgi:hypothetical protein